MTWARDNSYHAHKTGETEPLERYYLAEVRDPLMCPNGHDLLGEPIPEESQHLYDSAYFNRVGGIEVRGVYDGVLIWSCPECDILWPRFREGRLHQAALKIIERWEHEVEKDASK